MLKEKLTFKREKAVLITADFTASTMEGYALAWLKLCNNVRELKNIFWKIENDKDNKVYVICKPECKDDVAEFLTDIIYYMGEEKPVPVGKVLSMEEIVIGVPEYEYESTCHSTDKQWEIDIDNSVMYWGSVEEIF